MADPINILILDDSEDDREHCEELLQEDTNREWLITGIEDSNQGLNLLNNHHFDCVLLDYSLPGHSGIDVMNLLRENNVEVPVVMLTGQGNERLAVAAMKAGVQDYIPKSELAFPQLADVILGAIDQKRLQLELLQRANYDHLTGLAGRALFTDRLRTAINRSQRRRKAFALVFMDLDKFKAVNDTLGHKIGDLLLKDVARRMTDCLRDGDTVARLGGDEFVLLLEDLPGDGVAMAESMMERLSERVVLTPYELAGQAVEIGASMGAAICPTTSEGEQQLMDFADRAMYEVKRTPELRFKIANPLDS